MNVYLSHTTALKFWLTSDVVSHNREIASCRRKTHLPSGSIPELSEEEALALQELYGLTPPYHVSVVDQRDRRYGSSLKPHVVNVLPKEAQFVHVAEGLYVASPNLSLLQAASDLTKTQVIKAGFELCSTYRVNYRTGFTSYDEAPLMTVDSLAKLQKACSNLKGCGKLGAALPYIRDGSASPQETIHALMLGLPRCMGGKGLGVPLMNHEITLNEEAARLVRKNYLRCDMYWPEHCLDAEFESYEYHSGREALIGDSVRREALALMGVAVITVTREQTKSLSNLDSLSRALEKSMGLRIRPRKEFAREEENLRRTLASDWEPL